MVMNRYRLSVGPIQFHWSKQQMLDFYDQVEASAADIVYLGETVCSKRRELRHQDWLDLADRLIASGKLVNPGDVAWALAAGADFVTSARGFMFSLGCIQALKCNKNTCPTGITTHDPHLQGGLVVNDKYKKVAAYAKASTYELEMIAHSVGVLEPRQMRRRHVRIVQADGTSIPLDRIVPSFDAERYNAPTQL